jgi:dienelactone hydrolase
MAINAQRRILVHLALAVFGIVLIAVTTHSQSEVDDSLPRRAYLGVSLEKADKGVRIFQVTPGSAAAAAGIAVGDVIEAIDDRAVNAPEAVIAAVGKHKSGESVKIDLLGSGGGRRAIQAILKPYVVEQMANASVRYGSVVALPGVRLRTILSVPAGAPNTRFPAVLLIQGGGCGSIDAPFNSSLAQPGLMHSIGSQGFVTMRVEKSGVGDSEGPPCDSIGFAEELAGYRAALKALRSDPAVDPQRIYLIGISLGGVFAPLVAAETKVAGISVYGTSSLPPPPYPGRSARFFEEFSTVDVAGAWARSATRVQVLHGEYDTNDYVNRGSHEQIAKIVNSNGGSAQFRELQGLDHCWSRHASLEASIDKCGQGEATSALVDAILAFLRTP